MIKPDEAFDPVQTAKTLLREARSGALASLMAGTGDPYCSLVNVATAADGAPLLLLSRLAVHTKNILADPRVSLMLDERGEDDPLESPRVMIGGRIAATGDPQARRRYLARHPAAAQFADFRDFAFYRIEMTQAHLVAGFGRIVDLSAARMLTDVSDASELTGAEEQVIAHMNDDHADTLRLYATTLLGAEDGEWRCVGCDPEGLELQRGHLALRLAFPQRMRSPGVLRQLLKQLADEARASG